MEYDSVIKRNKQEFGWTQGNYAERKKQILQSHNLHDSIKMMK